MMIAQERPLAWWLPNGAAAQSLRQRIAKAVATLLLIIGFFVAGGAAITATPALGNDHVIVTPDTPLPCPGEKPGMCAP